MKNCITTLFMLLLFIAGGCADSKENGFQGYIEGEYVYLASSRSGRLETLQTGRGSMVVQNALLFTLEDEYEKQALKLAEHDLLAAIAQLDDMETGRRPEEIAMAEAQLNSAKAAAANAAALLHRHENLIKSGGISRQEFDDSKAAVRTTEARVAELTSQIAVYNLPERAGRIQAQKAAVSAAEARIAQARWEVEQKQVYAPAAGRVYDTLFKTGELVPAGSPVIQLLPPENIKIRFFVPESLIGELSTGSQVLVQADGRAEPLSATIIYISSKAEYTPPVIYSNETRSKLVFMVEAQPSPQVAPTLHPGQPVNVSLP